MLRRAAASLALVLALAHGAAGSQSAAPDPALALAALRVATLAERIAKLQVQSAHGVLAERSRRALQETVRELDLEVRGARSRAAPADVRDQLLLVAILCDEQRPWALRSPTPENARKVVERAEETVWAAQKAARLAGAPEAPVIVAQRAALLSQRVSRLHFAPHGQGGERPAGLAKAQAELRAALSWLAAAPGITAPLESEFQLAQNQLDFLSPAPGARQAPARRLEFASKAGDHLLESMTRLVRLYQVP